MVEDTKSAFEGWVVLELMGHRRVAGHLREEQIGGASFLRVDVVNDAGQTLATPFYSPSAVYCITPTTEEIAKRFATGYGFNGPVQEWELRLLPAASVREVDDDDDLEAGA